MAEYLLPKEEAAKVFDCFCKRVLKNAAVDFYRHSNRKRFREINFTDLNQIEESQLGFYEEYFSKENDEVEEKMFLIAGKFISSTAITEAVHSLPKDKQEIIQNYYYSDMTDLQIAKLLNLSNSTIQRHRQKCIKILKEYLEEILDEKTKK